MTTETFCALFDNSLEDMNFPNNSIPFRDAYFRWTTSVGYPIIMAFVEPGKYRFVITNSRRSTIDPYMFPFTYVFVFERDPTVNVTVWLLSNMDPHEYSSDNKAIKYYYTNPNAVALHRMNYDVTNWQQLLHYRNELSYTTRINMIIDSFYFYSQLNLQFSVALSSLQLLMNDTSHMAWESVDYVLAELDYLFRDSELYDWFLSFLGQLVYNYYMRYSPRAPVAVRFACKAGVRLCLEETSSLLQNFVTYRSFTPARDAVLCSGMRSATKQYYVFVEYLVVTKDRDRNVLLFAMTCFEDQALLERLLAKLFLRDEFQISTQQKYRLLLHMLIATKEGGRAVWKFFVAQHMLLKRQYGGPLLDNLLDALAKCLVSRRNVRIMRDILKRLKLDRKDIIETMKLRNRLLRVTHDSLKEILKIE